MPSGDDFEASNPYGHLADSDQSWDYVLNSNPASCWEQLIELFASMNAEELEVQREAFKKSRLQAEELGKTSNQDVKDSAHDIHEFLLLCEKAANRADSQ